MPKSSFARAMNSPPSSASARSKPSKSPAPAESACAYFLGSAPPALRPAICLRKASSTSSPEPSLSLASPPKTHSPDSPKPAAFGQLTGDLDLYYEDVYSLPGDQRIDYARRAEAAALAADTRIQNSDGGSFDAATGRKILANSRGFVGDYRRSYASISAVPIAQSQDGQMQRDYWYSSARTLTKLESPESVGAEAARRTVRRLDARRVPTQRVPVVFAPEMARGLIGNIFEAANGDAIYRHASFFANQLGEQVAARKHHRDRRRHHGWRFWHLALRWRRPAHAA